MAVPFLSRRIFLTGATASLLASSLRAQAASVYPAAAFADSVGVNTHLTSEPYASRFDQVRDLLGAARIRHVRDELRPRAGIGRHRQLFEHHRIRSHLLVSPATNTVQQMLDYLEALGLEKLSAIEGQNEGDSEWFRAQSAARGNWSASVTAYQREVFAALRPRYPEAALPILSPTVLDYEPGDVDAIRGAAPFCDMVAIHSYAQHGEEPETEAPYAALSWYLRNMRDRFKPGAAAMATETGYNTLVKSGEGGVSEAAAAIYIPRLLLNNFAAGVRRTFLYELLDEGDDPADTEQHWGLIRHDGTPKPAYRALSALLAAFSEEGSAPAPAPAPAPALALREAPADVRMLQLRKGDGSIVAAIWRAVRCWDPAKARDVQVEAEPLTLVLERPVSRAEITIPGEDAAWAELPVADKAIALRAGAKVTLVRLTWS